MLWNSYFTSILWNLKNIPLLRSFKSLWDHLWMLQLKSHHNSKTSRFLQNISFLFIFIYLIKSLQLWLLLENPWQPSLFPCFQITMKYGIKHPLLPFLVWLIHSELHNNPFLYFSSDLPGLLTELTILLQSRPNFFTVGVSAPALSCDDERAFIDITKCTQLSAFTEKLRSHQKKSPYARAMNDIKFFFHSSLFSHLSIIEGGSMEQMFCPQNTKNKNGRFRSYWGYQKYPFIIFCLNF